MQNCSEGFGFHLVTVGHLIKRKMEREHEEIKREILGDEDNIMNTDITFIGFLIKNPGKEIYQKDFEKYFSLTAPTVSNKLRDLEQKGLITRVYSKIDTRLKQVILTKKGYDIDEKVRGKIIEFETKINNLLNDEEKRSLKTILEKLKKELE